MQFNNFRITARGLVVQDNKLLFVSDDGQYWYPPGGALEKGESLQDCVERELYEETGLVVKSGALCYIQEHIDIRDNAHKIHFFFQTKIEEGSQLVTDWSDKGGKVKFQRFFSLEEMKAQPNIMSFFLTQVPWEPSNLFSNISVYQGMIRVSGFRMLEVLDSHQTTLFPKISS